MPTLRNRIAALVVSAVGLTTLGLYEGLKDKAYIPVPGDRPTIGLGSTLYEDGSPVKMGDKITKERAYILFKNTLGVYELAVKKCVNVPLHQYEFDAYVSLTYNIGGYRFCQSSIPVKLTAYDYAGACKEILRYDKVKNKVLRGLTIRRQDEYKTCLGQKEKDYVQNLVDVNTLPKLEVLDSTITDLPYKVGK